MRTLDLMRHIDQGRVKFHFCSLSGLPGELDEEVRSLGGTVSLLKLGRGFATKFRRLLRLGDFQVVHSHVHYFSGYILRLAAQAEIPGRIAHFRNMDDGKNLTLARQIRNRIMKGWINRYATDIVAVCEGAMRFAWGEQWQSDPRCRVIYNGLDLSKFNEPAQADGVRREFNLPVDCTLLIHIGRMVRQKNHERVVSIFKEVVSRQPNSALLLVGRKEADLENALREKVAGLNLLKKVVFAGERTDVPRLLKASDLMIFPSLWEGLPGAVLESCAADTPVLGSDLPGLREIAVRIPSCVRILPLEANDAEWALLGLEMINNKVKKNIKLNNFDFKSSVFSIEKCSEDFCALWQNYMRQITN